MMKTTKRVMIVLLAMMFVLTMAPTLALATEPTTEPESDPTSTSVIDPAPTEEPVATEEPVESETPLPSELPREEPTVAPSSDLPDEAVEMEAESEPSAESSPLPDEIEMQAQAEPELEAQSIGDSTSPEGLEYYVYYSNAPAGEIMITGYTGKSKNLTIPSAIGGIPVKGVDTNAFQGSILENVVLEPGVTKLDTRAFENSNLKSIILPSTLEVIGDQVFQECWNLKTIHIPAMVLSIGSNALDVPGLQSISVDPANQSFCAVDGVLFDKAMTLLMQYPVAKKGDAYTVPNGVTKIADSVFAGTNLKTVKLPQSLREIGYRAFYSSAIASIALPSGLEKIKDNTFADCRALKKVTMGNKVTVIGESAFDGCEKLASVTLSKGLKEIGVTAFYGTALTSVTFPDGLTTIRRGAFFESNSIKKIVLPKSVSLVEAFAFDCGEGLEMIVIPNGKAKLSKDMYRWDDYKYKKSPAVIYSVPGSAVEKFAKKYKFQFQSINKLPITKITLNTKKVSIAKGKTYKLKATLTPAVSTAKRLKWTSSNKKIATVSSAGLVKAKKRGKVVITVQETGGKKATCTVIVK